MSNVRIVMTDHGRGEVFIDEKKVNQVVAFSVKTRAGPLAQAELNTVVLEIQPTSFAIEGEFDVTTIESQAREWRKVTAEEAAANAAELELAKAG